MRSATHRAPPEAAAAAAQGILSAVCRSAARGHGDDARGGAAPRRWCAATRHMDMGDEMPQSGAWSIAYGETRVAADAIGSGPFPTKRSRVAAWEHGNGVAAARHGDMGDEMPQRGIRNIAEGGW